MIRSNLIALFSPFYLAAKHKHVILNDPCTVGCARLWKLAAALEFGPRLGRDIKFPKIIQTRPPLPSLDTSAPEANH